jgi:single-strand DNA-binding protein
VQRNNLSWEVFVSKGFNLVILFGNLGADPEVRSTSGGTRVATLSLATSRQWKNKAGEKQEATQWHRVILWDKLADIAEKYCHKGDRLHVTGEIQYRTWEDKEGNTRYSTEIVAKEILLASPPPADDRKASAKRNAEGVAAKDKKAARERASEAGADAPLDDDDLPF